MFHLLVRLHISFATSEGDTKVQRRMIRLIKMPQEVWFETTERAPGPTDLKALLADAEPLIDGLFGTGLVPSRWRMRHRRRRSNHRATRFWPSTCPRASTPTAHPLRPGRPGHRRRHLRRPQTSSDTEAERLHHSKVTSTSGLRMETAQKLSGMAGRRLSGGRRPRREDVDRSVRSSSSSEFFARANAGACVPPFARAIPLDVDIGIDFSMLSWGCASAGSGETLKRRTKWPWQGLAQVFGAVGDDVVEQPRRITASSGNSRT